MSIIKSALLGSAAVIAVVAGAQAADLPSKKAAPATYVKICDAYGAGFFYIPGSETCVRLGGYVRAEYQYVPGKNTINPTATTAATVIQQSASTQAETGYEVRGRIDVDARTPTSAGAVRTFVRLRAANTSGIRNSTITDRGLTGTAGTTQTGYGQSDASTTGITIESAMVQWAGFTFGVAPENYAMMPSMMYQANPWTGFPNGMKQIAYTAALGGGISATLALEDRTDFGYNQTAFDQPQTAANLVANVRLDQGWGFAAVHAMVGNNSITRASVDGGVGQKTYSGWAIGSTVNLKLPMIAAGDQIWITANYADGALGALLSRGGMSNMSTSSNHRLLGGIMRLDSNVVQTNAVTGAASATNVYAYDTATGWNLSMAATHYWSPNWRSNVSAGYVEINPPTVAAGAPLTWGKGKLWEVTGSLIYSPTKDFDIGLEVQYANIKNALQNASTTNQWALAGSPGLNESNVTTKLRVQRGF